MAQNTSAESANGGRLDPEEVLGDPLLETRGHVHRGLVLPAEHRAVDHEVGVVDRIQGPDREEPLAVEPSIVGLGGLGVPVHHIVVVPAEDVDDGWACGSDARSPAAISRSRSPWRSATSGVSATSPSGGRTGGAAQGDPHASGCSAKSRSRVARASSVFAPGPRLAGGDVPHLPRRLVEDRVDEGGLDLQVVGVGLGRGPHDVAVKARFHAI